MLKFNANLARFCTVLCVISLLATLDSCRNGGLQPETTAPNGAGRTPGTTVFYALNDGNQLSQVSTDNPAVAISTINITGLAPDERMMAIDFRPATGQLYGVTNTSRIYMINHMNGMARALSGSFSPGIVGDAMGFDFNPTVDRIRLVTNSGQDLRLNPETGTVAAIDGNINGVANASILGVAYTNNFSGATTTTLYDIDPVTDKLYIQNPPNNGTLAEVGPLGVDIIGTGGFDIAPTGVALAALGRTGSGSELYEINLTTGQAEKIGDLLPGKSIIGLAIPTDPVAYAVDGFNRLMIFNPMNPGTPIMKAITGLQTGEMIWGIDFRPANAQLYALGSTSRIYTINVSNGAATAVGGPFSPALTGVDIGFDFNPTVDRIRVVTNTGQNLRLNPDNGTVAAVDGALNPGGPTITAAAYTNNFAGATTTVLYDIDAATDRLVRQDPPNNGTLVDVGALGWNVEGANGFDIGGTTGNAYALLRMGNVTKVCRIDLNTGAATPIADFPALVQGMAVGLGF